MRCPWVFDVETVSEKRVADQLGDIARRIRAASEEAATSAPETTATATTTGRKRKGERDEDDDDDSGGESSVLPSFLPLSPPLPSLTPHSLSLSLSVCHQRTRPASPAGAKRIATAEVSMRCLRRAGL